MRRQTSSVLFVLILCLLLLPACGQTTTSKQGTGSSHPVQISVDAGAYHGSDPISVMVTNQSASTFYAPDHQTSCTIVQLQMRSGDQWQTMGECALKTPTRMLRVGHDASNVYTLTPPKSGWSAGTYRVALSYSQQENAPAGSMSQAYSSEFQVNA